MNKIFNLFKWTYIIFNELTFNEVKVMTERH